MVFKGYNKNNFKKYIFLFRNLRVFFLNSEI